MTETHRIWELARPALMIQGGTIHQIAKLLYVRDSSDLILWPDELCFIKRPDGSWNAAKFVNYDVFHTKPEMWVECTAQVSATGEMVTGLRVGTNLRAFVTEEQRGDR